MKATKFAGLLAMALFAVVALAASASAHEFKASAEGREIKAKALETQVFTTAAGKVECKELELEQGANTEKTKLKTESLVVLVKYNKCTAFGVEAKISSIKYLFMSNGTVKILNTAKITAPLCEVVVGEQEVSSVTYENKSWKIVVNPKVTGITSEGKGAFCTYAKESKGTYSGKSEVEASGATLEFV